MIRWMLALAVAAAVPASAQAPATIDQAAWLAGRWVGEGLGGQVEETWAPAAGGQMVGHFQLVRGGKPVFYELLLLDVQPNGLRMRVKHFNPDFTAWEDKAVWHSFEPDSVAPDAIAFKGLTLTRTGDTLHIIVRLKAGDGTVTDHPLTLKRAPL